MTVMAARYSGVREGSRLVRITPAPPHAVPASPSSPSSSWSWPSRRLARSITSPGRAQVAQRVTSSSISSSAT